jgi:hypothetical protein
MIILALSATALIGVAGLALDGGRLYGERREMQNAADSAAMAGTRQLDQLITGQTADASTILATVKNTAERNGADRTAVTCDLVRFDRTVIGPCPIGSTLSPGVLPVVAGVRVVASNTEETYFMKAVGNDTFTAKADATAQIGRPGGTFLSPFMMCATAAALNTPEGDFRLLIPDPTAAEGFKVNPNAVGHTYDIYGNDIKDGLDCGGGSSFRGRVCQNKNKCDGGGTSYETPGFWDPDTGNATGPTMRLVNNPNVCTETLELNCVLPIPLCPKTNGDTGPAVKLYCTEFGLFELTKVNVNHDVEGIFLGPATFNQGSIDGPVDANGSRIVALTD